MEVAMLDNNKIAFISCVSNQAMYDECMFYINNLVVPKGMSVEAYGVTDASSMTSGYQYAMNLSDAKYKVYLHQDVFITNPIFIKDLISIFESNDKIGLIGMIGTTNLIEDGLAIASWNAGAIYHNCTPSILNLDAESTNKYTQVEAVDGLILCTQVDLNWREDIFGGWDFYDISQCMEMKRAGYICATPVQEKPWVYHDNAYSKMMNYYKYRDVFVDEYQDIKTFKHVSPSDKKKAFDKLKEDSRLQLKSLIDQGKKEEVISLFQNPDSCGYLHLKDFEIISCIARYQKEINKEPFWKNDSCDELIYKLQQIRFAIKRKQFGHENSLSDLASIYGKEIISIVEEFNR